MSSQPRYRYYRPNSLKPKKESLHGVLEKLAGIATDADTMARDFRNTKDGRKLERSRKYFRFSVPHAMNHGDLSFFEKFPHMEALTVPFIQDMDYIMLECAKNLAHPSPSTCM
jgi:hypothetical protein